MLVTEHKLMVNTQKKEKGINAYHYRKSSKHKGGEHTHTQKPQRNCKTTIKQLTK